MPKIISPYRNAPRQKKGSKGPTRFFFLGAILLCLYSVHNRFYLNSYYKKSNDSNDLAKKSPRSSTKSDDKPTTINKEEKDTSISNNDNKFLKRNDKGNPDNIDSSPDVEQSIEKNTETHQNIKSGSLIQQEDKITPPKKTNAKKVSSVVSETNPVMNLGKTEYEGKIKSINMLGERNSGTTWIYEHLYKCFNDKVPVRRRLKRYKHWFQDENISINPIVNGTLVIAMFRNVYDWSGAMMATPHNAPAHMDLEWKDFLTKKWTMERVGKDLHITDEQKKDPLFCQEGFLYNDVVSCHRKPYPENHFKTKRFSEDKPLYEMKPDGSGEPFDNILEMRAAKIYNMLKAKNYTGVYDYWLLKYEDLLAFGTAELVEKVEKMTGVKAKCTAFPKQHKKPRWLEPDMLQYLTDNVDWNVERLIGYHPGAKL